MNNFQQDKLKEQLKENQEIIQESQHEIVKRPEGQSSTYDAYLQLLLNQKLSTHTMKEQIIKVLQENKVVYSEQKFYQDIHCKLITNTFNYEACSIVAYYGFYSTQISILNVQSSTPTTKIKFVGKGKYGQVYNYQNDNAQHAIKIANIQDDKTQFKDVLKEYFISLIASILDIGPKIINIYGFNLIFYRQTLEYSMKLCSTALKKHREYFESLKHSLVKFHLLNIIHSDIKPQNMAFDEEKGLLVLLDYGLSRIIKEEIGKKALVSTFCGTYDYCGQQMKNIFLLNKPAYINLYQNDVFGLLKSLNFLQNQEQKLQQSLIDNYKKQNYQSFIQNMLIMQNTLIYKQILKRIQNKYILFDSAIANLMFQSQIQKNFIEYINQFPTQFNFIRNLPIFLMRNLSFLITSSNKTYQILDKQQDNIILVKELQTEYGWQNEVFKKRIKQLQYFDTKQLCQYLNKNHKQQFVLFNPSTIAKTPKQKYYHILSKFIKINGQAKSKDHILIACKNMPNLFQQQEIIDYEHVYFAAFKCMLQFCMKGSLKEQIYSILQNIIQSIIILQIIPSQSLKALFAKTITSQMSFFKRIKLCFFIISCLQYTRYKYKSTYNYNELKQFLILNLTEHLNTTNKNMSKKQKLFSEAIKLALSYKTNLSHNYQSIIDKAKLLQILTYDQRNFLINQLFAYIIYCQTDISLSNSILQKTQQQSLIIKLVLRNLKHHQFTYHSCHLFMQNYRLNINQKIQKIYQTFMKQIGHFKQHKSFKIRIFYQLKHVLESSTLPSLDIILKHQRNNKSISFYEQLFQISNSVIQHKIKFSQLVQQLFLLKNLNQKNEFVQLLNKIIHYNKDRILYFSDTYAISENIMHENKLLHQIKNIQLLLHHGIIRKIFTQQQQQYLYSCYYKAIKSKLLEIGCFQCKVVSLIEVNITFLHKYFLYAHRANQDYQTLMAQMINLLIFCFKNPQLKQVQMRVMVNIISLTEIWKGSLQYVLHFYYQWMNMRQNHYDLLSLESLSRLFILMYTFIRRQYSQESLITFILQICQQLNISQSFIMIHNFYKNMIHMINQNKKLLNEQFHKDHHNIMKLMANRLFNPYVSVYFYALLECRIKYPIFCKVIRIISNSINYVNANTKYLILNKYYQYFIFYFPINAKRKLAYLKKMIQKYKETILTNKKISKFIKIKPLKLQNNKLKYKKLINCLNKYYINYKHQS